MPALHGGEEPPKVLLYIPFDGSAEAAFAANGQLNTSYIRVAYRPGKKGQAAEIGSDEYPCGLLIHGRGLLNKKRGSLELWYQPLWDPSDPGQQAARRAIITDEKSPTRAGHFWISLEGGRIQFAWRAQKTAGVSAVLRNWKPKTWHHIVATWDNEKGIALFVDGELASSRALRWRLPPSETLYLGANRRGINRAEGLFDEVRIYDRALSPTEAELAYIHNLKFTNAPVQRPKKPAETAPRERKKPRQTFSLPFDGTLEAQVAMGQAKPIAAEGGEFTGGLMGKALLARPGIQLAYRAEKNLSKEAGAITFWARSVPGAKGRRGVLFSEGDQPGQPARQPGSALALWLRRTPAPQLNFAIPPSIVQRFLAHWQDGRWHHVAACWQRGHEMTLYVNGRKAGHRSGPAAVWQPNPAKFFYVGSLHGKMPAGAIIDDMRVYDAPLTVEQVQKEASHFILPLILQLRQTLYERGKAAELVARFYNITAEQTSAKVTIRVTNPQGQEVASGTATAIAPPHGWAEARVPLSAAALSTKGLHRVALSSPPRVTTPAASFLVVAPTPKQAATEGRDHPRPNLEELETIECAKVRERARFCHSGRAGIVKTKTGSYVAAGSVPGDRFAYRFTVADTKEPHLVVLTYPNDRPHSAEIIITSPRYAGSPDVATGYFREEGHPATEEMVELPIYFWPREKDNAIVFRTLEPGRSAACAKITVSRVVGGLPSARVELPSDGGRPLGLYWHDPAVPLQFGARSLAAAEIYTSFDRLTQYLRFTGQNLLCYPVVWHSGVLYATEKEAFRLGAGAERHCNDWIEYALRLCERRAIRFVPEIFLAETFALADAHQTHTRAAIVAGKKSARMVMWDGTLSLGGTAEPPRYSPAHPAVKAALLDRIDEVAGRYGKSRAFEGISLNLGLSDCLWFGSIRCGYGDTTIRQFETDTNIKVPVNSAGPARFAQRARWLLANKPDQWVAWRCRKVHDLFTSAASRLTNFRPDLKLHITLNTPDANTWSPLFNLNAWLTRPIGQIYREAGIDLSLYAKAPGIVVRKVLSPTDHQFLLYRYGGGGPNPHASLARDFAALSEAFAPLRACRPLGAACSYRYFQSTIGRTRPMRGFWWRSTPWRASQPTPSGRHFLEPYAHAVAELDATTLAAGGGSLITMGHEKEVREFARAFRALPRAHFTDIPGMSDPVCARQYRTLQSHYFYLVNRMPFPLEAYVGFAGQDVTLHDLGAGAKVKLQYVEGRKLPAKMPEGFTSEHALPDQPGPVPDDAGTQPVTGPLLQVRLEPFQLRSYRVLTPGARIIYAASKLPVEQRLRLAQRIESAKSLVAHSKASPQAIADARGALERIDRAWRKRELSRVSYLLESYPLARLR